MTLSKLQCQLSHGGFLDHPRLKAAFKLLYSLVTLPTEAHALLDGVKAEGLSATVPLLALLLSDPLGSRT